MSAQQILPLFDRMPGPEAEQPPQARVQAASPRIVRSANDPARVDLAATLTERDLAMFADIRVPEDLLNLARIERVTNAEARDRFGVVGPPSRDMAGIAFPYPSLQTGYRVSARVRRDCPEIEDGKPKNKYVSPYGDLGHLYFPPGAAEKMANSSTPIVLVEAEKSALAITAWSERTGTSVLAIGMGGCYGWRGKTGRTEAPRGGWTDVKGALPDLHYCDGRMVYVMLDSNAATNPKVRHARRDLVSELCQRGCTVKVCDLPQEEGVNGPDDLIAVCGDGALTRVLDAARPTFASCEYGAGQFEIRDERGVYYAPAASDEDKEPRPPTWICSPLRVIAMTRDGKSGEWGRLLAWLDKDGVAHQWAMPMDLLQRDGGAEVRCELARQGLSISPARTARELLATYLQVWPVDARARCVDRLGWHGAQFVLPAEAIGQAGEIVVFQNAHAAEPGFSVSGSVEEWKNAVAKLAEGNSRLVFSICAAFAGTLLEPAGDDGGGFHFRGPSSTGKSTALQLAASVWGSPDKYPRRWRATINGLEAQAALHNDSLLILDELGQVDPREAGEAAYLLANGQGKARASRTGTARQPASWRLLFLSAGEESLSALMSRVGKKPTVGQDIRMAEIDADGGAGMGVIEELHACETPAALVTAIRDAAARFHGAVGVEWLRVLVENRARLADFVARGVRQFVTDNMPVGGTGQVERVARRFALVAVAGEMATRYGSTGWPEGEAIKAAQKCFASWLQVFGGSENQEELVLLAQVRGFVETHGASRFQTWDDVDHRVINRAGFVRGGKALDGEHGGDPHRDGEHNGPREFLVFRNVFREEMCAGFDCQWAVKILLGRGWLIPGTDGRKTQKPRLPGMGSLRVYVLGPKMWEGDE